MTALKPIENRNVRGVASERYPLNKKCAHPECQEDAVDPHHSFPRSAIGNDSWFVEIQYPTPLEKDIPVGRAWHDNNGNEYVGETIPHVTGLCRVHHDLVENHEAWIRLEDDVFVWYDRHNPVPENIESDDGKQDYAWAVVGPLNPQPGSVEGRRKRSKFRGEKRRKRATISIKVPKDEREDGAGLLDDVLEQAEARLNADEDKRRPTYYTLMDVFNWFLLNSSDDDFS